MCAGHSKRNRALLCALSLTMPLAAHAELIKPEKSGGALIRPLESHKAGTKTPHAMKSSHVRACPELFYNAIRSEAMVTALTCGQRDLYTQAVRDKRYASEAITRHFRSESAHLRYTTELANQQSLYDIRHYGKGLCAQRAHLLSDMSAVISDPVAYLKTHDIFIIPESCTRP